MEQRAKGPDIPLVFNFFASSFACLRFSLRTDSQGWEEPNQFEMDKKHASRTDRVMVSQSLVSLIVSMIKQAKRGRNGESTMRHGLCQRRKKGKSERRIKWNEGGERPNAWSDKSARISSAGKEANAIARVIKKRATSREPRHVGVVYRSSLLLPFPPTLSNPFFPPPTPKNRRWRHFLLKVATRFSNYRMQQAGKAARLVKSATIVGAYRLARFLDVFSVESRMALSRRSRKASFSASSRA